MQNHQAFAQKVKHGLQTHYVAWNEEYPEVIRAGILVIASPSPFLKWDRDGNDKIMNDGGIVFGQRALNLAVLKGRFLEHLAFLEVTPNMIGEALFRRNE